MDNPTKDREEEFPDSPPCFRERLILALGRIDDILMANKNYVLGGLTLFISAALGVFLCAVVLERKGSLPGEGVLAMGVFLLIPSAFVAMMLLFLYGIFSQLAQHLLFLLGDIPGNASEAMRGIAGPVLAILVIGSFYPPYHHLLLSAVFLLSSSLCFSQSLRTFRDLRAAQEKPTISLIALVFRLVVLSGTIAFLLFMAWAHYSAW